MWKLIIILMLLICSSVSAQEEPLIPTDLEVITPENASRIEQVAMIGRGDAGEVSWSPDGATLAVASYTGIWLYDARDWDAEPRFLAHFNTIKPFTEGTFGPFVEFSPDGQFLAFSAGDMVRLWDISRDRELDPLTALFALESIAFSPDSSQLLASGNHELAFWNTQNWQLEKSWQSSEFIFHNITFRPDGSIFATGGGEHGNVMLWNPFAETLESAIIGKLEPDYPTGTVISISFSVDGKQIVTSDFEGTKAIFYDVEQQTPIEFIEVPTNVVTFSPDGQFIATGNSRFVDSMLYPYFTWLNIFDAQTGEVLAGWSSDKQIRFLAFNPDSSILVTVDELAGVHLWDVKNRRDIKTIQQPLTSRFLEFSPDNRFLSLILYTQGAGLLKLETGEIIFSPAGRFSRIYIPVFTDENELLFLEGDVNRYHLRYLPSNRETLLSIVGFVEETFFSQDRSRLATLVNVKPDTYYTDYHLIIWDTHTGEQLVDIDVNGQDRSYYFNSDNTLIAAKGSISAERRTNILTVWDTQTGEILGNFESSPQPPDNYLPYDINNIVFNPIKRLVATASDDDQVILWDIDAGKAIFRWEVIFLGWSDVLQFNPEGTELTFINSWGFRWKWDVETGRQLEVVKLENRVDFSRIIPVNDRFVILRDGWNGELYMWDGISTRSRIMIENKPGFQYQGWAISFDKTLIAMSGEDGVIRLWGVPGE